MCPGSRPRADRMGRALSGRVGWPAMSRFENPSSNAMMLRVHSPVPGSCTLPYNEAPLHIQERMLHLRGAVDALALLRVCRLERSVAGSSRRRLPELHRHLPGDAATPGDPGACPHPGSPMSPHAVRLGHRLQTGTHRLRSRPPRWRAVVAEELQRQTRIRRSTRRRCETSGTSRSTTGFPSSSGASPDPVLPLRFFVDDGASMMLDIHAGVPVLQPMPERRQMHIENMPVVDPSPGRWRKPDVVSSADRSRRQTRRSGAPTPPR